MNKEKKIHHILNKSAAQLNFLLEFAIEYTILINAVSMRDKNSQNDIR